MEFNRYQELSTRTLNKDLTPDEAKSNYALGLWEAGELGGLVKKDVFHGHDSAKTREKVKDEMGDLLWYMAALANEYDLTMDEVAEFNLEKLRKRYPEGFSQEASQNRTA